MVSDSDLATRLREILRSSDLDTATPASVRRQLEADFGVDLTERKGFIREQIDAFLESDGGEGEKPENQMVEEDCNAEQNYDGEAKEEGDGEGEDDGGSEGDEGKKERAGKAKKRRGGGFSKLWQLSPQLENFIGSSQLARTEVVKKIWAYIREKNLQDPKNKRNIICDESLHSLFKVKAINMFQMSKALSKHIWPLSDGDGGVNNEKVEDEDDVSDETEGKEEQNEEAKENDEEQSEEEEENRSVRKTKRRKSAKSDQKTTKRGGGFAKVCGLSPELQAFTGMTELARTEVVKMLWKYIKENNLQDPSDKRKIICDEALRSLFPVDSINMFQMTKHLSKHIWRPEEVKGGVNNVKVEDEDDVSDETEGREEQNEEAEENGEEQREEEEKNRSVRKAKRINRSAKSDEKTTKRGGGFAKVCGLSPELQAFTGMTELARTEVVKMLWKYAKENNLQDPSDKRKIICDEALRSLFPVDSINMFQMTKHLSKHIWRLEEVNGGVNNVKVEDEDDVSDETEGKEEQNEEAEENGEEQSEKEEENRSVRKAKRRNRSAKSDQNTTKRGCGFAKVCCLSPELQAFTGMNELARTEVVKRLWKYIKENNLQDPSDKRKIICDEALRSLFPVDSINMFQMTKHLSKHIWPLEKDEGGVDNVKVEDEDDVSDETEGKEEQNEEAEENGEEQREEEENRSVRKVKKRKSAKSDQKTTKKGGGFAKVCGLSPELQAFTGMTELARTEVVKMLWKYAKENNLQDPSDKRKIICDEALRSLFPVDSINMFQMTKHLSKHIWRLEEVKGGVNNVKVEDEDDVSDETEGKEEQNEEAEENGEAQREEEEENRSVRKAQRRNRPAKSDRKTTKRGGGFAKVCGLSPELQAFTGVNELARTEVVKRLWKYIKENNLQDPSDKRKIICDEALRSLFPVDSINMFQMTKHLSKHIWPLEKDEDKPLKNGKRKLETEEESDDETEEKEKRQKKGGSGLLIPLPLSDALVKFLGTGENSLSRADVTKRFWDYIKQNDLQDPSDKRRILCDEKLKELFDVDTFNSFSVSKLLTNHFIKG
ncbi:PREDICTED: synaptonemal complex protein 1 isoform X5 [Tarenaya hassleriana]|uniref:synaptonemal complex protein 1 isoform X5 n=1 Tax=Tarenaya hassleriana TaxID=28532 RepID=UPI00053C2127|nr:PREDICTED: synaptonemal complex protein 1 isoform X5 [Tarenaya hassleriana]